MGQILQIILTIAAVTFFIWLLIPSKDTAQRDEVIDANDPRQIGILIGLIGGSIQDAATAQYALRRFEEQHGRKATVREMAIVAGMVRSSR